MDIRLGRTIAGAVAFCLGMAAIGLACVDELPQSSGVDGGDDGGDDGGSDGTAASDATGGDDASPIDGGSGDGNSPIDSGGPFVFTDPCRTDSGHTACCDFDDDAGINCLINPQPNGGSTFAVSSAQAQSLPASLHAKATGPTQLPYGRLALPGTQSAKCTFDLFAVHGDDQGNFFTLYAGGVGSPNAITLLLTPGASGTFHLIVFGPMGTDAGADAGAGTMGQFSIPASTWVRVSTSLTSPSSGNVYTDVAILSLDAGPAIHMNTSFVAPPTFGATVGLDYIKTNTTEIYYDNVVCDSK